MFFGECTFSTKCLMFFKQSDLLPAHKFDIFVTCHLKPLGVGVGRGGVGHVNVRLHLKLMLRHAWGWVVWGGACQRSFALAS